jgi:hypothetical protein
LPTAWNLPFQLAAGIHNSILMSESFDGFSVAATRQKAGRALNARGFAGGSSPPPSFVGVKAPRRQHRAQGVMVTFGSASEVSLSQAVAALSGCRGSAAARMTATKMPARSLIDPPRSA